MKTFVSSLCRMETSPKSEQDGTRNPFPCPEQASSWEDLWGSNVIVAMIVPENVENDLSVAVAPWLQYRAAFRSLLDLMWTMEVAIKDKKIHLKREMI